MSEQLEARVKVLEAQIDEIVKALSMINEYVSWSKDTHALNTKSLFLITGWDEETIHKARKVFEFKNADPGELKEFEEILDSKGFRSITDVINTMKSMIEYADNTARNTNYHLLLLKAMLGRDAEEIKQMTKYMNEVIDNNEDFCKDDIIKQLRLDLKIPIIPRPNKESNSE